MGCFFLCSLSPLLPSVPIGPGTVLESICGFMGMSVSFFACDEFSVELTLSWHCFLICALPPLFYVASPGRPCSSNCGGMWLGRSVDGQSHCAQTVSKPLWEINDVVLEVERNVFLDCAPYTWHIIGFLKTQLMISIDIYVRVNPNQIFQTVLFVYVECFICHAHAGKLLSPKTSPLPGGKSTGHPGKGHAHS